MSISAGAVYNNFTHAYSMNPDMRWEAGACNHDNYDHVIMKCVIKRMMEYHKEMKSL